MGRTEYRENIREKKILSYESCTLDELPLGEAPTE